MCGIVGYVGREQAAPILRHTRNVIYMEDGEVAVLTTQGVQCYNSLLQPITKEVSQVDWEVDAAEKGGYEHFMFAEICAGRIDFARA